MNKLQKNFLEHYEEMLYILHPRQAVIDNVNKMIHCGDSSYGGAMYHCPDCTHRHCVFTIPEQLRSFFLQDRSLLNCLFSSVRSVVLHMFHKSNKSKLFTPGFISVLHTFGHDLK